MTAKELFEKHGPGVWWAIEDNPNEKYFRPLGYSESGRLIIGENCNDAGSDWGVNEDGFILHQPPKQKVVRWKWAYYGANCCGWFEDNSFYTEDEVKKVFFNCPIIRLDYTRMEFEE